MPEPPHFRRILILWAALSIIATPIVVLVWAPDLPPGNGANWGKLLDINMLVIPGGQERTREEFRDFVRSAHDQGIYVILDVIA